VILPQHYYAIHLTDAEMHLAHVSRFHKGWKLESILLVSRLDEAMMHTALASYGWSKWQWANRVRMAVHPKSTYLLLHSLDTAELKKTPDSLFQIVRNNLHLDDVAYESHIIHPSSGLPYSTSSSSREWLFAGAKTGALRDAIGLSQRLGMTCERLELACISLIGGLISCMKIEQTAGILVTIFIGMDFCWALVQNQERLLAVRSLPIYLRQLIGAYQQAYAIDNEQQARTEMIEALQSDDPKIQILTEKLQREVEAFAGFFELQSGQTLNHIHIIGSIGALGYLTPHLARAVGMEAFQPQLSRWLESQGASWSAKIDLNTLSPSWIIPLHLVSIDS